MNTKRVTRSGGIGIPVGLRREMNIQPGDALDVEADEAGQVNPVPHPPQCVLRSSSEEVIV